MNSRHWGWSVNMAGSSSGTGTVLRLSPSCRASLSRLAWTSVGRDPGEQSRVEQGEGVDEIRSAAGGRQGELASPADAHQHDRGVRCSPVPFGTDNLEDL